MRNTKLWSVLLAFVLLGACVLGVFFMSANAADTATTYTVNTANTENDEENLSFKSIADALAFAAKQDWKTNEKLVIEFTGTEVGNVADSNLMFGQETIWRRVDAENAANTVYGNRLPIEIAGQTGSDADVISVSANVACANNYVFKDLTLNNWTSSVAIYAGSGQIELNSLKTNTESANGGQIFADCFTAEAFEGWYAEDFNALKDEDDTVLTSVAFVNTKYYAKSGNSTPSGVCAVGAAYSSTYSYTAPSAEEGDSVVISPEKTKAKLEMGTGSYVYCRVGGYNAKTPARVHTAIIKQAAGSKSRGISGDSGADSSTRATVITNGNIVIDLESPIIYALGIRVLYGSNMVNTADVIDNADGSVEYGNITVKATNVTGYDGNAVYIDGSGNKMIPGKCIVNIDGWSGTTPTTVHSESASSHEFEYIGIGAKKGIETTLKGCLLYGYSGTRITKSTEHKVAFPIKNTLIDCRLTTRYYVSSSKNVSSAYMFSAVSMRNDTPLNHTKTVDDATVADPLECHVGDVTNVWTNVESDWPFYGVGSVPFTKVGNVCNTINGNDNGSSYLGGHFYGVGATASCGNVTNKLDSVEFLSTKDYYGTFSSSAASTAKCGEVLNHVTDTKKTATMRGYYGTAYGNSDSVTNNVEGGSVLGPYFGTYKTTVSGNIVNNLGAVSVTGDATMARDKSCKEILNTFDGATLAGTVNGTYSISFTKVTNTFKSGIFNNAFYGCYGGGTLAMGDVVNNIEGGSFNAKNYIFGGYGGESIKSVTNTVSGNPSFNYTSSMVGTDKTYYAYDGVCFGVGSRLWPSKVLGDVKTTIKGGTFKGHTHGGGQTGYVVGDINTVIEGGSFWTFYGAGYSGCNTTDPTASTKQYLQDDWGKICGGTVRTTFGKAGAESGPTFSNYVFGGDCGSADRIATMAYDIYNVVNAATFNGNFYGGSDTAKSNVDSVTNEILGGTFVKRYYGGSNNAPTGTVKNVIKGGTFAGAKNVDYLTAFLGGGAAPISGGVINEIHGGTFAAYVIAGGNNSKISNSTEGAPAISNTITGGTFNNFWGGNSRGNSITGDIVNNVSGGTFDSLNDGSQVYPNSFNGGNRNGAHANGNITNNISGGNFKWHFTAGNNAHDRTLALEGVAPAFSVITNITGGIFEGHVFADYRPGRVDDNDFRFKTAILNITPTEGKALEFYASVRDITSFDASSDTAVTIGKNAFLGINALNGTLKVNQNQQWLPRTYVIVRDDLAASIDYTAKEGAFVVTTKNDTELRGEGGIGIASATLLLSNKIQLNLMLDAEQIDALPADYEFTFKTEDDLVLAAVNAENIGEAKDGYYHIVLNAIGLRDFDKLIICDGNYLYRMEMTVISLADLGAEYYTETSPNAVNAQLFKSIADLGRKANGMDTRYGEPVTSAVNWTASKAPEAVDSTRLNMRTMGLIMTDAIGIRLTGVTAAADTPLKFFVNGVDVTSSCVLSRDETAGEDGTFAFTVDLYVNLAAMTNELNLVITDDTDAAMFTMTLRVDALAEKIYTAKGEELTNFALAYIQAADTYKKAQEV